jgi:hypothetical protein
MPCTTEAGLESAIKSARESMVKAGELSQHESEQLKEYLRCDLEQGAKYFEHFKEQAKETLQPARMQAGFLDFTSMLAHNTSQLFDRLAEWADNAACYQTGQITSAGTLKCRT